MKAILSAVILTLSLISGIDFASAEESPKQEIKDIINIDQSIRPCRLWRC